MRRWRQERSSALLTHYRRFRQKRPFHPSEICWRPFELRLTLAPRRPALNPTPLREMFANSPGAIRFRFLKPNPIGYAFSQATPSLSRSSPRLYDIALL